MKQDKSFFDILQDQFEEAGYAIRSYSGRFMYGRACVAVAATIDGDKIDNVVEVMYNILNTVWENIVQLETADSPEDDTQDYGEIRELRALVSQLGNVRWDSLGVGSIIYWPDIEYLEVDNGSEVHDYRSKEEWYAELKKIASRHLNTKSVLDFDSWTCDWLNAVPEDVYYGEFPEHKVAR